ncbi:hypothetical protein LY76DRAFT_294192 [Colletotrichum caudatum]|nr:hypothetical protein LY76DRAFT_294192 [Colletotrichum caudatum]
MAGSGSFCPVWEVESLCRSEIGMTILLDPALRPRTSDRSICTPPNALGTPWLARVDLDTGVPCCGEGNENNAGPSEIDENDLFSPKLGMKHYSARNTAPPPLSRASLATCRPRCPGQLRHRGPEPNATTTVRHLLASALPVLRERMTGRDLETRPARCQNICYETRGKR